MTPAPQTYHATDERRYTPQELALLWQCSIDVIYDLLNHGKLIGFKVGSNWRIRHDEVLNYENDPRNRPSFAPAVPPIPANPKHTYKVI